MKQWIKLLPVILLAGCTTNSSPYLPSSSEYIAIGLMPQTQHIGDIYSSQKLLDPVVLMRDVFSQDELEEIMHPMQRTVTLENIDGKTACSLSIKAEFSKYTAGNAEYHKTGTVKLRFGEATEYLLSHWRFDREIYPELKHKCQGMNFEGRYLITALLKVSSFEYEYLDEHGGKIEIESDALAKDLVKQKFGIECQSSKKHVLMLTEPAYIGYRIARIGKESFGKPITKGGEMAGIVLEDVTPDVVGTEFGLIRAVPLQNESH